MCKERRRLTWSIVAIVLFVYRVLSAVKQDTFTF